MGEIGEFFKGLFGRKKAPLPKPPPQAKVPDWIPQTPEATGIAAAQQRQEKIGQDWLRSAAQTMPGEAATAARNALEDLAQRQRLGIDEENVIEGQFRPAEEKSPTPTPRKK